MAVSAIQTAIEEMTRKAVENLASEIEDVLAGLLINGVCPSTIELHYHPDKTVISVAGESRYEFRTLFTMLDEETAP